MVLSSEQFEQIVGEVGSAPADETAPRVMLPDGTCTVERRKETRIAFGQRAKIRIEDSDANSEWTTVMLQDISVQSVSFLSDDEIGVATLFELCLKDQTGKRIRLRCNVQRCEAGGFGGTSYAVAARFEELLPEIIESESNTDATNSIADPFEAYGATSGSSHGKSRPHGVTRVLNSFNPVRLWSQLTKEYDDFSTSTSGSKLTDEAFTEIARTMQSSPAPVHAVPKVRPPESQAPQQNPRRSSIFLHADAVTTEQPELASVGQSKIESVETVDAEAHSATEAATEVAPSSSTSAIAETVPSQMDSAPAVLPSDPIPAKTAIVPEPESAAIIPSSLTEAVPPTATDIVTTASSIAPSAPAIEMVAAVEITPPATETVTIVEVVPSVEAPSLPASIIEENPTASKAPEAGAPAIASLPAQPPAPIVAVPQPIPVVVIAPAPAPKEVVMKTLESTPGELSDVLEYTRWTKRSLSGKRFVYMWAAEVPLGANPNDARLMVLTGAAEDGQPELIAFHASSASSAAAWKQLLINLMRRGLTKPPKFATGARDLGFWSALAEFSPATRKQFSWDTQIPHLLNLLPRGMRRLADKELRQIGTMAKVEDATKSLDLLAQDFQLDAPDAAARIQQDKSAMLAYHEFPIEHHPMLRQSSQIQLLLTTDLKLDPTGATTIEESLARAWKKSQPTPDSKSPRLAA